MKLLIACLLISFGLFAKKSMDQFNDSMMENIHTIIKNNPEKYETKNIGRKPASITPVMEEKGDLEEKRDYINKRDKHSIGLPKW